ncbi:MAG: MBL fold metallo-hydrolase [Candidatus Thiodiazotropha sp.]
MARMKAPKGGCTVRMYRHGLGDCFLLAFGAHDGSQKYMLIDCGVLSGTENASTMMNDVAKDILQATNKSIDVLVITHEHWDHISGFSQAQQEFAKLKVGEVWFAWTENPRNPLARELRERQRAALNGLQVAMAHAGNAPKQFTDRINAIGAFFGDNFGINGRATTENTLEWIKKQWTQHRYCVPGGVPITLNGLEDVRFYVMGPPENARLIRKSRPSSQSGQVYLDDAKTGELGLYLSALGAAPAIRQPEEDEKRFTPFNEAYHCDYGHPDVIGINQRYEALENDWRKIDSDWTGAASELALRLDEHTNNTSLVLAIELARNDKVLLFTGDAQVGNWLSWDNVKWSAESNDDPWGRDDAENLKAKDLLERTVLYKVGHHGSHNATLQEQGLERMTNQELVALIPVDPLVAEKRRWRMPHKPLYDRLYEKTLGRLVISKNGLPDNITDEAIKTFLDQCEQHTLYCDYTINTWLSEQTRSVAKKKTTSKRRVTRKKKPTTKKTTTHKKQGTPKKKARTKS